jgi:hypothetical protein
MGAEPLRVTRAIPSIPVPRSLRGIGARGIGRMMRGLVVAVLAVAVSTDPAHSQIPDSLQVADSLALLDSLAFDSLAVDQESDSISADTIFYNLPRVESRVPAGYATGIWEWDREAIMASGANTLAELFREVPGLITLLAGDYGTPLSMTAFGLGGAGYRVTRDGFELYPVDGGVADLQRIGLGAITYVRLDRSLGQMRVDLRSHEYDDGQPLSVVEAGTGDLATNMFRGVYADPTALLGSLAVGLERIDTRGRGADEGGNRTGSWVRYQLHLQERAGIAFDLRRMGTQTKVPLYAPTTTRTDAMVRATLRITPGVVVEGYTGRSSYDVEDDDQGFDIVGGSRAQHGGSLGMDRDDFWANGSLRVFEGDVPSRSLDASGGFVRPGVGGANGAWSQSVLSGRTISDYAARVWVGPLAGITLFGAYQDGEYGSRDGPIADNSVRPPAIPPTGIIPGTAAITDRTTLRAGATMSRWGVTLGGAALYARSDVALPLGTEVDFGAPGVPGVHRKGYEGAVTLPVRWEGLTLQGSYQWWDEEGPNLPKQVYRGSFEFHRVFKESGNLELWGSAGVRGHDPMLTFVPDDGAGGAGGVTRVPFFQSWYGRVQVRIVTVRLFLGWENYTIRRNNQNYPGRLLPFARTFFGLRWDMWN